MGGECEHCGGATRGGKMCECCEMYDRGLEDGMRQGYDKGCVEGRRSTVPVWSTTPPACATPRDYIDIYANGAAFELVALVEYRGEVWELSRAETIRPIRKGRGKWARVYIGEPSDE